MTSFASAVIAGASHHQPILHAPNTTYNVNVLEEQLCEVFNTQTFRLEDARGRVKLGNLATTQIVASSSYTLNAFFIMPRYTFSPTYLLQISIGMPPKRFSYGAGTCAVRTRGLHTASRFPGSYFHTFKARQPIQLVFQTGQCLRPLITTSCFSSMVSISHNMAGGIEAANQHREMTSEIVSSLKVVRQRMCM